MGDSQGHMAEVIFEFSTQEEGMGDLLYEEVDKDTYSKVRLVNARTIVYEWTARGKEDDITVNVGQGSSDKTLSLYMHPNLK